MKTKGLRLRGIRWQWVVVAVGEIRVISPVGVIYI